MQSAAGPELISTFNCRTLQSLPFSITDEWDKEVPLKEKIVHLNNLLLWMSSFLTQGNLQCKIMQKILNNLYKNIFNIGAYLYRAPNIPDSSTYIKLVGLYISTIIKHALPEAIRLDIFNLISASDNFANVRNKIWGTLFSILDTKVKINYKDIPLSFSDFPDDLKISIELLLLFSTIKRIFTFGGTDFLFFFDSLEIIFQHSSELENLLFAVKYIPAKLKDGDDLASYRTDYMQLINYLHHHWDQICTIIKQQPTLSNTKTGLIHFLGKNIPTPNFHFITSFWLRLSIFVISLTQKKENLEVEAQFYPRLKIIFANQLANYPIEYTSSHEDFRLLQAINSDIREEYLQLEKTNLFLTSKMLQALALINQEKDPLVMTEKLLALIKEDLPAIEKDRFFSRLLETEQISQLSNQKLETMYIAIWNALITFHEESFPITAKKIKDFLFRDILHSPEQLTTKQIIFACALIGSPEFLKYLDQEDQIKILQSIRLLLNTDIIPEGKQQNILLTLQHLAIEPPYIDDKILIVIKTLFTDLPILDQKSSFNTDGYTICLQKLLSKICGVQQSEVCETIISTGYNALMTTPPLSPKSADICFMVLGHKLCVKMGKELKFLNFTSVLIVNPLQIILQNNTPPSEIRLPPPDGTFHVKNISSLQPFVVTALKHLSFLKVMATESMFQITIKHLPSSLAQLEEISFKKIILSQISKSISPGRNEQPAQQAPLPAIEAPTATTVQSASVQDDEQILLDLLPQLITKIDTIIKNKDPKRLSGDHEKRRLEGLRQELNDAFLAAQDHQLVKCNKPLGRSIELINLLLGSDKSKKTTQQLGAKDLAIKVQNLLVRLEEAICTIKQKSKSKKTTTFTKEKRKVSPSEPASTQLAPQPPSPPLATSKQHTFFKAQADAPPLFCELPACKKTFPTFKAQPDAPPLFCGLSACIKTFPADNAGYAFMVRFWNFIVATVQVEDDDVILLTGGQVRRTLQKKVPRKSDMDFITTLNKELVTDMLRRFWQQKNWPELTIYTHEFTVSSNKIGEPLHLNCVTILPGKDSPGVDITCVSKETLPLLIAKVHKGLNCDQYYVLRLKDSGKPAVYSPNPLKDIDDTINGKIDFTGGNPIEVALDNPYCVLRYLRLITDNGKHTTQNFCWANDLIAMIVENIPAHKFMSELKHADNLGAFISELIKAGLLPKDLRDEFLSYYNQTPKFQAFCRELLLVTDDKEKTTKPNLRYILTLFLLPRALKEKVFDAHTFLTEACKETNPFICLAFSGVYLQKSEGFLRSMYKSFVSFPFVENTSTEVHTAHDGTEMRIAPGLSSR